MSVPIPVAAAGSARAPTCAGIAQSRDSARGLLVVADPQNPVLSGGFAIVGGPPAVRFAIDLRALLAVLADQGTHVDCGVAAHNYVFAARPNGEAGANGDRVVACIANDFEAAHRAGAVQIAVMKPVLRDDVVVQAPQVLIGQQLPGKEPGAAEALEPIAGSSGCAATAFVIEGLSTAARRQ